MSTTATRRSFLAQAFLTCVALLTHVLGGRAGAPRPEPAPRNVENRSEYVYDDVSRCATSTRVYDCQGRLLSEWELARGANGDCTKR
jgi:hypothetical protein